MTKRRWFLPGTPDLVAALRRQLAVTGEGVEAFQAWARDGDPAAAERIRHAEMRGNVAARAVLGEVRAAFVTPLEPEDIFALSRGIDRILDYVHDVVGEATVMATRPDPGVVEMAGHLRAAVWCLDAALAALHGDGGGDDGDAATAAADEALRSVSALDAAYARGMAGLLTLEDRTGRIGLRELYRRCERIGDVVTEVAERVVYAVVKQS